MFIDIIRHTPLYVWPILAYIIYIGVRALSDRELSLKKALILPLVFMLWCGYSFFSRHIYETSNILFFACTAIVGVYIGFISVRIQKIRIDKKLKLIHIPGSPFVLAGALCIFALRYTIGLFYGMHLDASYPNTVYSLELISIGYSSLFLGRFLRYLKKYYEVI